MHGVGQNRGRVCMGAIFDKGVLHRLTVFFWIEIFLYSMWAAKMQFTSSYIRDNQTNEI